MKDKPVGFSDKVFVTQISLRLSTLWEHMVTLAAINRNFTSSRRLQPSLLPYWFWKRGVCGWRIPRGLSHKLINKSGRLQTRVHQYPGYVSHAHFILLSSFPSLVLQAFIFCVSPLRPYRDIIDIKHDVSLRCTAWWFDIRVYYKTITPIRLVSTSITAQSYHFLSC